MLARAPHPTHPRTLAPQVKDKKGIYVTIVGGLVVVAFVAPMIQFFWYTGGE